MKFVVLPLSQLVPEMVDITGPEDYVAQIQKVIAILTNPISRILR